LVFVYFPFIIFDWGLCCVHLAIISAENIYHFSSLSSRISIQHVFLCSKCTFTSPIMLLFPADWLIDNIMG
jgi:hypothetical protein